ncbi:MAG: glycoside hydrolase family 16 protein [Rhodoferax sp.]|jgi:beta-glucanase (GH16 family)|nr:glycoside hydrolase family 16 protein [Rhodoferax sp.]
MRCSTTTASLLIACALAGCGGGGGGSAAAAGEATAVVPGPAPVASAPVAPPASAPVSPVTPTVPAAATLAGFTRLAWADEFSTTGLPDASKWAYDTERNQAGWYNNELQYYASNRLENAQVLDGNLIITARKERLTTAADFGGQNYTSARMITRGIASWTYGFFEVRAKLPCSLGTWPAIWMLGTGGVWPDDGEIDLMEQRGGSAADKTVVLGTIHTRAYNYFNGSQGVGQGSSRSVSDACTNFHSYQLIWDEGKVAIGVDGVTYFTYNKPVTFNNNTWPFDNPQYLILNLAMGGDLGGAVPIGFVSDQMVVDYVRVYQK